MEMTFGRTQCDRPHHRLRISGFAKLTKVGYLAALVVKAFVEVPEPLAPEVARGLSEERSQLGLVQLASLGMPALPKQLPHILECQLPTHSAHF